MNVIQEQDNMEEEHLETKKQITEKWWQKQKIQ